MNQSPSIREARAYAVQQFNVMRTRAVLNSWLAKLLLKPNGLRSLVGSNVTGLHGKRLARIQRICVDKIVGTIRYNDEFDQNFRPLKFETLSRWVQTFLQLDQNRWHPIVVHKTEEFYYVADGKYRVSVARSVGMKYIEAEVWDHSSCQMSQDTRTSLRDVPCKCEGSFSTN